MIVFLNLISMLKNFLRFIFFLHLKKIESMGCICKREVLFVKKNLEVIFTGFENQNNIFFYLYMSKVL